MDFGCNKCDHHHPLVSFGDDVYCTLTPNDGLNSGTLWILPL